MSYEQTLLLTRVSSGDDAVPFVLMPGTVGSGVSRRKMVGGATSGAPTAIEIKGDILQPQAQRKYSVARLTLTFNSGAITGAEFGPQPVRACTMSFNAPFGSLGNLTLSVDEAITELVDQLAFLMQYIRGGVKFTTGASSEITSWNDVFPIADVTSGLKSLFEGIR